MVRNNITGYRSLRDMSETERTVSGKKFFVHLAGRTNGAHLSFVKNLKSSGQIEVHHVEHSDYLVVFCPIASRVGTDVSEALENMPGGKPVILVVMHHTFNPNHVVAPSSRQVTSQNVLLTVDCLFYEGNLLQCDPNDGALKDVMRFLRVPYSPDWITSLRKMFRNHRKLLLISGVVLLALLVIVPIIVEKTKK